ncbi:MAG: enoyl-CoA hydratase/isomerase family protein [Candidatus Hodarchaeales archaeon]|jgi:enoyl-CoA hydratase
MGYSNLIVTTENFITTIKINREKALNALNEKTILELKECVNEIKNSNTSRVLIITGAGEKAFIAGADITGFQGKTPITIREMILNLQEVLNNIEDLSIPVIASINGYCLGGGLELAMACDLRIASDKTILGQPEIKLGLIPGAGGTQRLSRLIGSGKAKEMIMLGENISADIGESLGLLNWVVPHEKLTEETDKIASKLANGPSFALNMVKEAINRGLGMSLLDAIRVEGELFALCFASDDVTEGVDAFLNKKKPNFN